MIQKVLYIDDDPDLLVIVSYLLENQGVTCISCSKPQDALTLALQEKPDVILLDVMLGADSLEDVLKQLRAQTEISSIPVIAITGKEDLTDLETLPLQGILKKPFDPSTLLDHLTKVVDTKIV